MEVNILPIQQQAHYTHRIRVTHEDLTETTANTAQTIAIFDVVDGDCVTDAAIRLVTAFKDASDTALNTTTLIVGDGGDTARYIASAELNENGSEVLAKGGVAAKMPSAYVTTDTVDAIFGSMADKSLSDVDVGVVDIYLKVVKLAALSREGTGS